MRLQLHAEDSAGLVKKAENHIIANDYEVALAA
jgi:hypothetical protein